MQIFRQISDLQDFLKDKNQIGFVPTMGFLHEGHLSLVRKSKQENPVTVISIFVNPSQFNDSSDFEKYPRDEAGDLALLKDVLGEEDCVFVPREFRTQNSPARHGTGGKLRTQYTIPRNLKNCMCGKSRPGHFEGVVAVVGRFLEILFERLAVSGERLVKMYLGKKDYQQVKILQDFVEKCFENVEIVECETVREKDRLAMSSRNVRLNGNQREIALNLYKAISDKRLAVSKDRKILKRTHDDIVKNLQKFPEIKIDYIEIRDADDLNEVSDKTKNILIAGAIFVGDVRLIDNVVMEI